MSRIYSVAFFAALVLGVAGCKNVAPDADEAAVIVQPTDASRQALQDTVNGLFASEVMLAPNALTDSSVLHIEPGGAATLGDEPLRGRVLDDPIVLRLVTNGADCILIDTRDMSRHVLADTTCIAE